MCLQEYIEIHQLQVRVQCCSVLMNKLSSSLCCPSSLIIIYTPTHPYSPTLTHTHPLTNSQKKVEDVLNIAVKNKPDEPLSYLVSEPRNTE
jgi:hypothetical protein